MEIGVLELLTSTASPRPIERLYGGTFRRQYASIAPQAVAAWCRRLGHRVHYATWYGQSPLDGLLPDDLDVVFVSCYTQSSLLAYAMARLFKRAGVRTALGGPHARAFPRDSARFFDFVIHDCDAELIADILAGRHRPGSVLTSGRPLTEVPSVEERMADIRKASFNGANRAWLSHVALLTSVGCPYRCDFCTDWVNPYHLLPGERLREDLRYVAEHLPGIPVSFHDPNFGVRFDQTLDVLEELPADRRPPYVMESSLSILRSSRLERLRRTRCLYVAPGIESWGGYSNKAGVGPSVGRAKLEEVIAHFEELHEYVPGLQANFIFGTDDDHGEEPVALTREFIRRTPFVWPTLNIPVPFGGTPLHERYRKEGRILESMPFFFYYLPYLVLQIRGYDPVDYYRKLAELYCELTRPRLLARRLAGARNHFLRALHFLRTAAMRGELRALRRLQHELETDAVLRAYHDGRNGQLPPSYLAKARVSLGLFREVLDDDDLIPLHDPVPAIAERASREAPLVVHLGR